jgi:DNA-binding response OmpR family regulator
MMPHILIVEDDARLASVLTKGLGESGFTTTHSPDAETALTLLHSHPFDLALIDVMLPKMNGIGLTRERK